MNTEQVVCSDCLEHMRTMPDNSVDAIVTDPPYGMSFMGAKWDSFGGSYGKKVTRDEMATFQAAMTPIFEEAMRVAKPGAHLLCFGGTRTFHRMACAIEDAGWEVRDCVMWIYGSGFPKSMNVSKAIEKKHGSDVAAQWDGWGTCLKPAWEPIIVARKPLDGTVAHNVMTHGTGAINIDGCRVPTEEFIMTKGVSKEVQDRQSIYGSYGEKKTGQTAGQKLGRFPANLVHDGSQEVIELFPDTGRSSGGGMHTRGTTGEETTNTYGTYTGGIAIKSVGMGDSGSAARFFYCAKASKKERGEGNHHPTVKPIALMKWLVTLVTPEEGVVLDPFAGSGTTLLACKELGRSCIGIEREPEYVEIIKRRLGEI